MKLNLTTATRAYSTAVAQPGMFKHKGVRLIVGGWTAFILENLIISQNREALVTALGGEGTYKMLYASISTAACASIIVGYGRFGIGQGPQVGWRAGGLSRFRMLALPLQAFALMLVSQTVPELSTRRMLGGGCPFAFPPKNNKVEGV